MRAIRSVPLCIVLALPLVAQAQVNTMQRLPRANPAAGIVVQGGREAIGPKQDDSRAADCDGIIVQGGREAIGPKQDDPRSATAAVARPGDDNDPKAGPAARCQAGPAR